MSLFLLNSRLQLSLQLPWWKMHTCACKPLSCHSSLFSSMLPSHLPTSRSTFHIHVQFWNELQCSPTWSHGSIGNDLGLKGESCWAPSRSTHFLPGTRGQQVPFQISAYLCWGASIVAFPSLATLILRTLWDTVSFRRQIRGVSQAWPWGHTFS